MPLDGKKIAFLVAAEGIEQVELTEPWQAVQRAGGSAVLVASGDGPTVQAYNHLDKADTFKVDLPVSRADAAEFDGLVLPGGVANLDQLRTDPEAVAFAKAFVDAGRPTCATPGPTGWTSRWWSAAPGRDRSSAAGTLTTFRRLPR